MKTIKVSRQGFANFGCHSWLRYIMFVLSKKYNVIIDAVNPDLILQTNWQVDYNEVDPQTKELPTDFKPEENKNIKFLRVTGEAGADSFALKDENVWIMDYQNLDHPRHLRQPSGAFDVWTMFDEARVVDSPLSWLTEKRDYEKIKDRNTGLCCVTQNSNSDLRAKIFDKLSEYKQVVSSGAWRGNAAVEDKDQNGNISARKWGDNPIYRGRHDGLVYKEKIEFSNNYKFFMAIHWTDTDYILQEKIYHGFFSGCIPLFYGNKYISEVDKFNPDSFINLHDYCSSEQGKIQDWKNYQDIDLDKLLEDVKEIDTNESLRKKYIEAPIFIDNKLPDYYSFDYVLDFLERMIES